MNNVKIFQAILLICSTIITFYIFIDLPIKKKKFKNRNIDSINNTKYVFLICILVTLFFIYGISRNFN